MYLSNLFDVSQTGFKVNYSTKTALVRIGNDLQISSDNHKGSILALFDLSAAFVMIDHIIFLQCLEHCLGLRETALNWLSSYLTGKAFFVSAGNFKFDKVIIPPGVLQWSVLGPLI